jgi:hypothetical protein
MVGAEVVWVIAASRVAAVRRGTFGKMGWVAREMTHGRSSRRLLSVAWAPHSDSTTTHMRDSVLFSIQHRHLPIPKDAG